VPLILSLSQGQIVDIGDLGTVEVRFDVHRRRAQLVISGLALGPCKVRKVRDTGNSPDTAPYVDADPNIAYKTRDPGA
jgi:hypothetical protein